MKTVYRADEIAHAFIHKSSWEGRVSGCHNAWFREGRFYSYATEIARHGEHKGKPYLVRDTSSFSSNTGKIQNRLTRALLPGVPVFSFNHGERGQYLNHTPASLFEYAIAEAAKAEADSQKPRLKDTTRAFNLERSQYWLAQAQRVNEFFNLRRKVDSKTVERVRKAAEVAAKRAEKDRQAMEKRRENERTERKELQTPSYEAWKAGDDSMRRDGHGDMTRFDPGLFPTAFRQECDELVSTLGARVPLDAARVALRFIIRKRGQEWRRNGETCPVGSYQIDSIGPNGIIAGCHRFGWDEVERVAALLQETEVAA